MEQVNGTPVRGDMESANDFLKRCIEDYVQKQSRPPALIVMSSDVLRRLGKEAKLAGGIPKDKVISVSLMLKEPMVYGGVEIVVCGGENRMALI